MSDHEPPRFLKADPFPYLVVLRDRGWVEVRNELAGENMDDWLLTAWQAVKEHRAPACLITSPSRVIYLGPLGDSKASGTVPAGIAEYIATLGRKPVGFDWVALRDPRLESHLEDALAFVDKESVALRWLRQGVSRDPLGTDGFDELYEAAQAESALLGDDDVEEDPGEVVLPDDDDAAVAPAPPPPRVDIPQELEMDARDAWDREERFLLREPVGRETVFFVGYSPRQDQHCVLAAWRPDCFENLPDAEEAYWKLINVLPSAFVRGEEVVGRLRFGFSPWVGDDYVHEITFPEPHLVSITQYYLDAIGAEICLQPVPVLPGRAK